MKTVPVNMILLLMLVVSAPCAQPQDATDSRPSRSQNERDKVHSREMRMADSGHSIPERIARTQGDLEVSCTGPDPGGMGFPPQQAIENVACGSDLVVTGTMISHASHMTDDERFIFTDWSFVVDEVLMNAAKPPVAHGSVITVAIPGGQLNFDGRTVTATCHTYRDTKFETNKEYMLFLTLLPESGTYRVRTSSGFAFSGSSAKGMGAQLSSLPEWAFYDRERVISTARIGIGYALSGCHKSKQKSNSAR